MKIRQQSSCGSYESKRKTFSQSIAEEMLNYKNIIIICGHYEGVDQRVVDVLVDEEISLGDFILTGGEIAAMAIVDATARLIPGVLKEKESYEVETFNNGLLEYPQYTRPAEFRGIKVPDVLLSGHHENIEKWRKYQSIKETFLKRPDLLNRANLTEEGKKFLNKYLKKKNKSLFLLLIIYAYVIISMLKRAFRYHGI